MKKQIIYTSMLVNSMIGSSVIAEGPAPAYGQVMASLDNNASTFVISKSLKMSAQKGNSKAQLAMARFFESQDGYNSDESMKKWYLRSAMNGNAEAQFQLGLLYADGEMLDGGRDTGLFWLEQAKDQGHHQAGIVYDSLLDEEYTFGC